MSKTNINILVALGVAGILFYFLEEDTLLAFLALAGLGYLVAANNVLKIA